MSAPQIDPKRMAMQYLHIKGVTHADLITGDHAADLLVQWSKHMTDCFNAFAAQQSELSKFEIPHLIFPKEPK